MELHYDWVLNAKLHDIWVQTVCPATKTSFVFLNLLIIPFFLFPMALKRGFSENRKEYTCSPHSVLYFHKVVFGWSYGSDLFLRLKWDKFESHFLPVGGVGELVFVVWGYLTWQGATLITLGMCFSIASLILVSSSFVLSRLVEFLTLNFLLREEESQASPWSPL